MTNALHGRGERMKACSKILTQDQGLAKNRPTPQHSRQPNDRQQHRMKTVIQTFHVVEEQLAM